MRQKYRERAVKLLPGKVLKAEVIQREDYDIIKLTYDDDTSIEINSYSDMRSQLEVGERD